MSINPSHLFWIDLEMTGLHPEHDRILEIASIVTDSDLNIIAEGPSLILSQPESLLAGMDSWNTKHHGKSGLTDAVKASTITDAEAEKQTLAFLSEYLPPNSSPLCGNSIGQDRRFLVKYMPNLAAFAHYRNLDVSSFKIAAQRWRPGLPPPPKKQTEHRALADIKDSIDEMRYYKETFFSAE